MFRFRVLIFFPLVTFNIYIPVVSWDRLSLTWPLASLFLVIAVANFPVILKIFIIIIIIVIYLKY